MGEFIELLTGKSRKAENIPILDFVENLNNKLKKCKIPGVNDINSLLAEIKDQEFYNHYDQFQTNLNSQIKSTILSKKKLTKEEADTLWILHSPTGLSTVPTNRLAKKIKKNYPHANTLAEIRDAFKNIIKQAKDFRSSRRKALYTTAATAAVVGIGGTVGIKTLIKDNRLQPPDFNKQKAMPWGSGEITFKDLQHWNFEEFSKKINNLSKASSFIELLEEYSANIHQWKKLRSNNQPPTPSLLNLHDIIMGDKQRHFAATIFDDLKKYAEMQKIFKTFSIEQKDHLKFEALFSNPEYHPYKTRIRHALQEEGQAYEIYLKLILNADATNEDKIKALLKPKEDRTLFPYGNAYPTSQLTKTNDFQVLFNWISMGEYLSQKLFVCEDIAYSLAFLLNPHGYSSTMLLMFDSKTMNYANGGGHIVYITRTKKGIGILGFNPNYQGGQYYGMTDSKNLLETSIKKIMKQHYDHYQKCVIIDVQEEGILKELEGKQTIHTQAHFKQWAWKVEEFPY